MEENSFEIKASDIRALKSKLQIRQAPYGSYIVVLAIHATDDQKNGLERVPCGRGIPLEGYVYDSLNDCYMVRCVNYLLVGSIPISFQLSVKGHSEWETNVPMPESVLKKYLSRDQKSDLQRFKAAYSSEQYVLKYIQMVDCF